MEIIKELIAKLSLDNSKFKKGIKESKKEVQDLGDDVGDSGKKSEKAFDKAGKGANRFGKEMAGLGKAIAGVFVVTSAVDFVKKMVSVTAEFQKMEAVLTNTFGSESKARLAMAEITDFASKTPFQVNELTDSFVKLANRGIVPTMDQMTSLGDLASSTGKSFDQLTEALLDGMTGEFERLKEFGIRASSEGDRVKFTFKGVTTEVEKTDEAIKDYILSLGQANGVSGAMAKISETVGGKLSNLDDNITQLFKSIGDGSSGLVSGVLDLANSFLKLANNALKSKASIRELASNQNVNRIVKASRDEIEKLAESYKKIFPKNTDAQNLEKAIEAVSAVYVEAQKGGEAFRKQSLTFSELKQVVDGIRDIGTEIKVNTDLSEKEKEELRKAFELKKREREKELDQLRKINQEFIRATQIASRDPFALGDSQERKKQLEDVKKITEALINPALDKAKKGGLIIPQDAIDRMKYAKEQSDKLGKSLAMADVITGALGQTLQGTFEAMIINGNITFRSLIDGIKALIVKLIAAAAAALALNVLLGGIGLGGGKFGGMAGFKDLFSSLSGLPKFAEGGMVTGMTTAILGDNPSGKEAVIPFEKMGSFLSQFGGGGNMRVEVVGRTRGEDIFWSGVNYQSNKNKIIGG